MDLVNNGTIPSTSRVPSCAAASRCSQNARSPSHLAVVDAGAFSLTADYFRIRLADRLALTQLFALTPTEVDGLLAEGVTSARNLQNFASSPTTSRPARRGSTWSPPTRRCLSAAARRSVSSSTAPLPRSRASIRRCSTPCGSASCRRPCRASAGTPPSGKPLGRWRLLGRFSYYDEWFDSRDLYVYHGDAVFDVEAAYTVSESTTLTVGAQNAFGNDPEANPIARAKGNRFSVQTPVGANGAFYYARINYGWASGG